MSSRREPEGVWLRTTSHQSEHDRTVIAAGAIYRNEGKPVWLNPDGEQNKGWSGRYIDIIALEDENTVHAWVIEVETADSVSDAEARKQWKVYAEVYLNWYLAVPRGSTEDAAGLLKKHGISNCTVVEWLENRDRTHLPVQLACACSG